MNTPANPPFAISADHLGPVLSLDGKLTKNGQNLIFARNGTGKSFLSRAFRYLDSHQQGKVLINPARNLVSDESPDGTGDFIFSRGSNVLGELHLEKNGDTAELNVTDRIFHVFSGDFVQEELREQEYHFDGIIENQISVDSVSIQVKDAQQALKKVQLEEQETATVLNEKFNFDKDTALIKKAEVRRQLKEYGALRFEDVLEEFNDQPSSPDQSFMEILKDLDYLKAIPSDPVYPDSVTHVETEDIDLEPLTVSLMRETSPSSVSEKIKQKIEKHHGFYQAGLAIVQDEHRNSCPFCEQQINSTGPKSVIDAYLAYFADKEEKHKAELRSYYSALKGNEKTLLHLVTQLALQKSKYDSLKKHLPSQRESQLRNCDASLELVNAAILALTEVIEKKVNNLDAMYALPEEDLIVRILELNRIIEDNNGKVDKLNSAIKKSDDERKSLQRNACAVFKREFVVREWSGIQDLKRLRREEGIKEGDLKTLKKSAPSTDARSRVADTFELLLRELFAEKYVFNKETFTLKRGVHEMVRGPHRTLSDGEKTAISFCYFIACVHRKVETNSDYRKLFLVFDDPVTSMSYEYVFAIAQTLKNLNISDQGVVSTNPGLIDGNKHCRPELLILTHSSYFFNISVTNKVVDAAAAFALLSGKKKHLIKPLDRYVAPFQAQLKDIYDVAQGEDANHATANSIRAVLEAVGRFCRPDKSGSLTQFVQHLAGEEGINVKSILINSLCHGTYYEETVPPDDLELACKETLMVVERYAAGQLEILNSAR